MSDCYATAGNCRGGHHSRAFDDYLAAGTVDEAIMPWGQGWGEGGYAWIDCRQRGSTAWNCRFRRTLRSIEARCAELPD